MAPNYVVANDLPSWLLAFSQRQITQGQLNIKDGNGRQWSLYFQLGHLVGEADGVHPIRRWRRQLSQCCPLIDLNTNRLWQYGSDYESLAKLVRANKIRREQMVAVVSANVLEVLFDLIQYDELLRYYQQKPLSYTYIPEGTLYSSSLVFIQPDRAWKQAQQAWASWRQAGLEDCSPNLAPVLLQPAQLQASANVYRSLTTLVDGQRTLRDLAVKLRTEPLLLTQSIMPYVRRGVMKLVEVEDINQGKTPSRTVLAASAAVTPPAISPPSKSSPLVAYIDDSPRDSQIMGKIVVKAGYHYVNFQDSVQALPKLLESKPSLIFLDLVMPIANGYEICAQIRRTTVFKDTPVIIVTNSDGIIDRVRAKIVRSTDFIAKPVNEKKVLAVLRQHLSISAPLALKPGYLNNI